MEFQDDALAVPTFELLNAEWEELNDLKLHQNLEMLGMLEHVGHSLNANKARVIDFFSRFAAHFQDSGASNRSCAELSLKQRGSSAAVRGLILSQQKGLFGFYFRIFSAYCR